MKPYELHCETVGIGEDGLRRFKIMFDQYIINPLDGRKILLPEGFIFNGANIPRGMRNFLIPTGKPFNPSGVHDFGLVKMGLLYLNDDGTITFEHHDKAYIDRVFNALLKVYGVNCVMRPIAYAGVKLFGKGNY